MSKPIVLVQPRVGRFNDVRENDRAERLLDERAIYARYVKGKTLVYLDTNLWIRLSHGNTPEDRECLAVCRAVRASGQVIFPLSYALWSELLNQQPTPSMRARAKLMDELSDGISFRDTGEIRCVEAEAAFPMTFGEASMTPDRSRLFTFIKDCLGDSYAIADRALSGADFASWVAFLRSRVNFRSLEWIIDNMDLDRHRAGHAAKKAEREQLLVAGINRAADNARNAVGKVNFAKALAEEREALFKKCILPTLNEVLMRGRNMSQVAALLAEAKEKIGVGSPKRLAQLMAAMPSTGHSCELWARRLLNTDAKYDMADFWDTEHAEIPPMYCDAFAVEDKGLRHLVNSCKGPPTPECAVLANLNELKKWLERRCGIISDQ